jgi:hypothetical protein
MSDKTSKGSQEQEQKQVTAAEVLEVLEQSERRAKLLAAMGLMLAAILIKGPFGRWAAAKYGPMLGVLNEGSDSWGKVLDAIRARYDEEWPS